MEMGNVAGDHYPAPAHQVDHTAQAIEGRRCKFPRTFAGVARMYLVDERLFILSHVR
jgi:hypothetical protein